MAQFGGNKNQPWNRAPPPGLDPASLHVGMGLGSFPPPPGAPPPPSMPGLAAALSAGGPGNPSVTLSAAMAAGSQVRSQHQVDYLSPRIYYLLYVVIQ